MKWINTVIIMIIIILTIFFSIQNDKLITLRFGLYPIRDRSLETPELPIFLFILCSVFLGVLIGGIGDLYQRFQLKKALRQNEKMIEKLSKEVETLRKSGIESPSLHTED